MGCCGQPSAPADREAARPAVALAPIRVGLTGLPAIPCACRSDVPAEPAPRPETPTSDHRPEQDHAGTAGLPVASSRPALVVPHSTPAFGLSLAPLFLNTTRLLI
jgi:hypothetical protein